MENLNKGLETIINQAAMQSGGLPELPVKTEYLRKCAGMCNATITLHTFKDGTTKESGCKCDAYKALAKKQEGHKQRQFIKQSKLPYSKYQADFDKYVTTDDKRHKLAKAASMQFAKNFTENFNEKAKFKKVADYASENNLTIDEANKELGLDASEKAEDIKTSLIMMGTPGTGKTMLSCAIFYEVAAQGFKCFFIESTLYIEMLKDSFDDKNKKATLLRFIQEADLLIVDDIGTSFNSPWAVEQFKMLTDMRKDKFTIYTTNLKEAEFLNDTSLNRIYSRMNQGAYRLKMDFKDKRIN